jgi:predicted transcriptional regulator of viral defense system
VTATRTHPAKTLGRRSARLVTGLYSRGRRVFRPADVTEVTGLSDKLARDLADRLVQRGIATRLRPGLYNLVPFELGDEREFMEHPFVVARELMRGRDYYISHASAMDAHQMVTQPQLVIYVTSPHQMRGVTILGTEYRFVRCQSDHFFGVETHWVAGHEQVTVSDLERTVLDGLRQPEYCGGITEVAKGLWIRGEAIDVERLVGYALRLGVGAVTRRLGYLLEQYALGTPSA